MNTSRRQALFSLGALALAACAAPTAALAPTPLPRPAQAATAQPAPTSPPLATAAPIPTAAPTSVPATLAPTATALPKPTATMDHAMPAGTATAEPTKAPTATRAPEPTKAAAAPTPAPTPAGATFKADITLFAFKPFVIEVPVGSTVIWTNNDLIEHSVTSGAPEKPDGYFNSGFFTRGKTFSFTFDKPGRFPFYCMRHTSMTGEVVVK